LKSFVISLNMTMTTDTPTKDEGASDQDGEPSRTWVSVAVEDDRWEPVAGLTDLIPKLVAEALIEAGLSPETHDVSIALLSDSEVRTLNRLFRGKDAATNVLSFPPAAIPSTSAHAEEQAFLGDIALAYETVAREADTAGKPILHHAAHLVVHGVLHLAGLDHDEDARADHMEAAERAVLARFGLPDPYGDAVHALDAQISS
jgi:probable rRNA maturation factor